MQHSICTNDANRSICGIKLESSQFVIHPYRLSNCVFLFSPLVTGENVMLTANKSVSGTYVDLKTFVNAQHFCESVEQLASYLGMKPNAVRQRIKFLIRRGYSSKLRTYPDLIGKKGRGNFAKQIAELPDFDESQVGQGEATVKPIGWNEV